MGINININTILTLINQELLDNNLKTTLKPPTNIRINMVLVIGMIHLAPLPGTRDAISLGEVIKLARHDLFELLEGGVDQILIENNYDIPHRTKILPETLVAFSRVLEALVSEINVPWGVCVLWNDYHSAYALASSHGASFIRIPVLVDSVKTQYGIIEARPKDVVSMKAKYSDYKIKLYADVQVKHSEMMVECDLNSSIDRSLECGVDGLIITGKWTGDLPIIDDLKIASQGAKSTAVIAGSGVSTENIEKISPYVSHVIVGSAFKEGTPYSAEIQPNLFSYSQRISRNKVAKFMNLAKGLNN